MLRLVTNSLALLFLALASSAWAATERYDYDALGRLVRYIGAQGQVTEYVYDAAGNILEVKAAGALAPPAIATTTPISIRRGQRSLVHLTGTGFAGASVRSVDPVLLVSGVIASSTTIDFGVDVPVTAALGPRSFEVSNSGGLATTTLQVIPELTLSVLPVPIALLPDGVDHQYTLQLSEASPFAQSFTAVAANPSVLRVTTPTVTLPAGSVQAELRLAGLATGSTQLLLSAPGAFEPVSVAAFVGAEAAAANVARSTPLGLVKGDPTAVPGGTALRAVSVPLGLVKGDPTAVPGGTQLRAVSTALGLVKGDPTAVPGGTQLGAVSPALGLVRGDPTAVPAGTSLGPVVARPVGVNRL